MKDSNEHCLKVPAQRWNLKEIREFCKQVLGSHAIDPKCFRQLILAIDEAAANVVEHAYPPGEPRDVELKLLVQPDCIIVEVRDTGMVFNPVTVMHVDLPRTFARRGYGLPLIRRIMDEVSYRRSETGENVFTLLKRLQRS